jgi:calcium-independent phospholipase A2-gamma
MRIVLSLDGDGVRGLSTAVIVDALVTAVGRRIGRKLEAFQIFDIIGGTSTGGLLAIMLGRFRIPSDKALNAYLDLSKTLFTNKYHFFKQKQHLIRPGTQSVLTEPEPEAHSLEQELKALAKTHLDDEEEPFWDTDIESPNVFVISTLISNDRMRPAIIRSYPTRRITNPVIKNNLKTWEAMCATAARLRYTNVSDASAEPSGRLVDGSIKKSNPIKEIFYECRSLYHINDPMMMVSIGSGAAPNLDATTRLEFRDMAENVLASERSAASVGAKFEYDERDIMGTEWLKYFRFCDPGLADCGLEEFGERDRIEACTRRYLGTGEAGQRFQECVEAIARVVMGERLPDSVGRPGDGYDGIMPYTPGYADGYVCASGGLKRKRPG